MKKFLLTLFVFFMSISSLLAQVPPPPDNHENASGPGAPSALPIDNFSIVLLGIAMVIGIYFLWNRRKIVNQF